jgi:hypothetical protein
MKIIDEIIHVIERNGDCTSSRLLAGALASACSPAYKVSFIELSVSLDEGNKKLITELLRISQHDDFDNADQDKALKWLKESGLI